MYSFPNLESVCCSMSSSNCCFLTCIQISQEAGQVVWYYHLFQNFPEFVVVHTVKGFSVVNKAEVDVFLELSCFFDDPSPPPHIKTKPPGQCAQSIFSFLLRQSSWKVSEAPKQVGTSQGFSLFWGKLLKNTIWLSLITLIHLCEKPVGDKTIEMECMQFSRT